MRSTKRIIFAFRTLGEAGQTATLAKRTDTITTAGQNFVGISLMSNVPNQNIVRCVEHVMQSGRQFDNAKPRAQMPTGNRNRIDGFSAQFIRDLLQLGGFQFTQIFGNVDGIQQRSHGFTRNGSLNIFRFDFAFLKNVNAFVIGWNHFTSSH